MIRIRPTLSFFAEREVTDFQITSSSGRRTQVLQAGRIIESSSKNKTIPQRTNNRVIYKTPGNDHVFSQPTGCRKSGN